MVLCSMKNSMRNTSKFATFLEFSFGISSLYYFYKSKVQLKKKIYLGFLKPKMQQILKYFAWKFSLSKNHKIVRCDNNQSTIIHCPCISLYIPQPFLKIHINVLFPHIFQIFLFISKSLNLTLNFIFLKVLICHNNSNKTGPKGKILTYKPLVGIIGLYHLPIIEEQGLQDKLHTKKQQALCHQMAVSRILIKL